MAKITFFFRYSVSSMQAHSVVRRIDEEGCEKQIRPFLVKDGRIVYEKDDNDETISPAPYIAGASANDTVPFTDRRALWNRVFNARALFIPEGEKCVESLNTALLSAPEWQKKAFAVMTMGGANNAPKWSEFAPDIASRMSSQDACDVIVLADKDEPGRQAAIETALSHWNAGFRRIKIVEFTQRPDGTEAPEKYDIADWIEDINAAGIDFGAAFNTLIDPGQNGNARKFYGDQYQLETNARIQLGNLPQRALSSAPEFPQSVLPKSLETARRAICEKYQATPAAVVSCMLSTIGGLLGAEWVCLEHGGSLYYPLVHTCVVGKSGSGKSPLMKEAVKPLRALAEEEQRRRGEYDKEELEREKAYLVKKEAKLRERGDAAELATVQTRIRAINALTADLHVFCVPMRSPEGVKRVLDRNIKAARLRHEPCRGTLIHDEEGTSIFGVHFGVDGALRNYGTMNNICDRGPANGETKDGASQFEAYLGAGFLVGIQPGSCRFADYESLMANGLINRFNWVMHTRPESPTDRCRVIDAETAGYHRIFTTLNSGYQGQTFIPGAGFNEEFKAYTDRLYASGTSAEAAGDDALTARCGKAETLALQIAIILHVATAIDNEALIRYNDGGSSLLPEEISRETLQSAIKLAECLLQESQRTLTFIEATMLGSARQKLTPEAKQAYEAMKNGSQFAAIEFQIDGVTHVATGRQASISDIRKGCRAYRDEERRKEIDKELMNHGLMFLKPAEGGRNNKPLRIAVITA